MSWLTGIVFSVVTALAPVFYAVPDLISALVGDGRDKESIVVVPTDTSPSRIDAPHEAELVPDEVANVEPNETPPPPAALPAIKEPPTVQEQVTAATPLSLPATNTVRMRAALYPDGVYGATNAERYREGLPILKRNALLDRIAQVKVDDMFARQYFAHESPSGDNVADLAKQYGYSFLTVGENLASGSFSDNRHVVQAWMDSPGHRANILSGKYKEIGIAVKKGTYKGYEIWMAVQAFGLSSKVCTAPDKDTHARIEQEKVQLGELFEAVGESEATLRATRRSSTSYEELYKAYVDEVNRYNSELGALKKQMDEYNNTVTSFNECLSAHLKES